MNKDEEIRSLNAKVDELSGELQVALKDIIYYQEEYQKLFDNVQARKREVDPVNYLKLVV